MNKKKIIILIVIIAIAGLASVFTVGMLKKQNRNKKAVDVYPVNELGSYASDFYFEDTLSGNIMADMEQKLYISQDQKIKKIKVKEGQKVRAGDVLLIYDTTAQQLQIQSKEAAVEMARTAVIVAERELKKLENTTPVEPQPEEPEISGEPENPDNPGSTEEPDNPDYPGSTEDPENPEQPEDPDTPTEPENPEQPENPDTPANPDNTDNPPNDDNSANADEAQRIDGDLEESDEPDELEITYTKEELDAAIADKKEEIASLKIDYEIQQVELEVLKYQTSNGEVLANFDGIIKTVNNPEEALINNEPVVVVGGSGGYTVEAYVGENSLTQVSTGDYVSVFCYDTGLSYEGMITEISNVPSENYYSDGQESYYPVTVSLSDDEGLAQGMWAEIYLDSSTEGYSDSIYIELPFVKKDNGSYYVMKEEDGKLVKCKVTVGKTLWNSYMEIKSGVTMNDYLAFPYAQDAQEGVKTNRKSYYEAMYY
ncbi:MAG: HlyD family efflux transporter periplasmic adaptor subunit [Wujia sp.]